MCVYMLPPAMEITRDILTTVLYGHWRVTSAYVTGQKSPTDSGDRALLPLLSTPPQVRFGFSSVPTCRFGVYGTCWIKAGTEMGPYIGRVVQCRDIDMRTPNETMWEVFDEAGEILYFVETDCSGATSWLSYINCARNEQEQNLEIFQSGRDIYYRAIKDIPPDQELLVWYSSRQDAYMGIPGMTSFTHSEYLKWKTDSVNRGRPSVQTQIPESPTTRLPLPQPPPLQQQQPAPPSSQQNHHHYHHHQHQQQHMKQQQIPWRPHAVESNKTDSTNSTTTHSTTATTHTTIPTAHTTTPPIPAHCTTTTTNNNTTTSNSTTTNTNNNNTNSTPTIGTRLHCVLCRRGFNSRSNLRSHMRIHTLEKPFACKYCTRSFSQSSTLRNHTRLHTGERPYRCIVCQSSYSQLAGLRAHQRSSRHRPHNNNNNSSSNNSNNNNTTISNNNNSSNSNDRSNSCNTNRNHCNNNLTISSPYHKQRTIAITEDEAGKLTSSLSSSSSSSSSSTSSSSPFSTSFTTTTTNTLTLNNH